MARADRLTLQHERGVVGIATKGMPRRQIEEHDQQHDGDNHDRGENPRSPGGCWREVSASSR